MSDETKKMIDAASHKDGAAFKAEFEAAISQKVGAALSTQRQEIAKNTFGNIRVPAQDVVEARGVEKTFAFKKEVDAQRFIDELEDEVNFLDRRQTRAQGQVQVAVTFENQAGAKKASRLATKHKGK